MQWGPDVDAKLFMYVLKIHNVKLDYQALATAMGNDVTPKAITHRIAKLRQIADEHPFPTASTSASPGISLPSPRPRTPNKRPRARATTTASMTTAKANAITPLGARASSKRKAVAVAPGEADAAFADFVELGGRAGGGCEEGEGVPSKKVKGNARGGVVVFGDEHGAGEDDGQGVYA